MAFPYDYWGEVAIAFSATSRLKAFRQLTDIIDLSSRDRLFSNEQIERLLPTERVDGHEQVAIAFSATVDARELVSLYSIFSNTSAIHS